MSLSDNINDALDMEERSTPSDKLFKRVAIICSVAALLFAISPIIAYCIQNELGLTLWSWFFYPQLVAALVAAFFSIAELLRNDYVLAKTALILMIISVVVTIAFMIYQQVALGEIYLFPFIYF